MSEPVLIFGSARTGSSFVVGTLQSHPQVLAHGEPFQMEHLEWHFNPLVLPLVDLSFREREPYQFIRWLYRQSFGRRYVMLKILFGQNDETLWRLLNEFDVRVIYFRRPNRLAHFASYCLAYETNIWNANRGEEVDQNAQIRFDPSKFKEFMVWQDGSEGRVRKIFRETERDFLECNYEPCCLAATSRSVADWLGIDPSELIDSSLVRMRSGRVIDRFSNPEIVMDVLSQINRPDWIDE